MNTKIGVLLVVLVLMVISPFSAGLAQDEDEPLELYTEDTDQEQEAELMDIMGTAEDYGYLGVLIELLNESGLAEELTGDGPYTLFAPDDSAFATLDAETLERLSSDVDFRKEVLSLHILKGRKFDIDFDSEKVKVKTLGGVELEIDINDEGVMVGSAWIIDGQIECSNGVIHVIDAVLLPEEEEQED